MKRLRNFGAHVWRMSDSPSLTRDLFSLLSAWRVGFWFLVMNVSIMLVASSTIYAAAMGNDGILQGVAQVLGLGQYASCMLLVTLGGILTLLVPLRTSGIFEGVRWARYFDQVVISGISPERYFAGKVASINLFFALVLIASAPYAIFTLNLSGSSGLYVLKGMAALWLYANLLCLVTLAFSVFFHEIASVIVTILFFGFLYGLGVAPIPPLLGMFTPAHLIMEPFWDAMIVMQSGGPGWDINFITIGSGGDATRIGNATVFLVGSLSVCAWAMMGLLLGPVRSIIRVNSTFGEVVMPDDAKRKRLFRRRFTLRRRSELAFFFENRSPWFTRWELLLRYGALFFSLLFLSLIAFVVLHYFAASSLDVAQFSILNLVILGVGLILASGVFCSDRATEHAVLRAGGYSCEAGQADTVAFFWFAACTTAMAVLGPVLHDWIAGTGVWFRLSWRWDNAQEALEFRERVPGIIPLIMAMAAEFYAAVRLRSMSVWSRTGALLLVAILLFALWFMPFFLCELLRNSFPEYFIYDLLFWVGVLCPVNYCVHALEINDCSEIVWIFMQGGWYHLCLPLHLILAALLGKWALVKRRRLHWENNFDYREDDEPDDKD